MPPLRLSAALVIGLLVTLNLLVLVIATSEDDCTPTVNNGDKLVALLNQTNCTRLTITLNDSPNFFINSACKHINRTVTIVGTGSQSLTFGKGASELFVTNGTLTVKSLRIIPDPTALNTLVPTPFVVTNGNLALHDVTIDGFTSSPTHPAVIVARTSARVLLDNVSFLNLNTSKKTMSSGMLFELDKVSNVTSELRMQLVYFRNNIGIQLLVKGRKLNIFLNGEIKCENNRGGACMLFRNELPDSLNVEAQTPVDLTFINNTASDGAAMDIEGSASFKGPITLRADRNTGTRSGFIFLWRVGEWNMGAITWDITTFSVTNSNYALAAQFYYAVVSFYSALGTQGPKPVSYLKTSAGMIFANNIGSGFSIGTNFNLSTTGNILFENNHGGGGLGISHSNLWQTTFVSATGTISFCNNSNPSLHGGALGIRTGSNVVISARRMEFMDNYGKNGGAIGLETGGSASSLSITVADSMTFVGNRANISGGAIFVKTQVNDPHTIRLVSATGSQMNLRFERNSAVYGGAIWTNDDSFAQSFFTSPMKTTFTSNSATLGCVFASRAKNAEWSPLSFNPQAVAANGVYSNNVINPVRTNTQVWNSPLNRNALEQFECEDISQPASACPPQPSFWEDSTWHRGAWCVWEHYPQATTTYYAPATMNLVGADVWLAHDLVLEPSRSQYAIVLQNSIPTLAVNGTLTAPTRIVLNASHVLATTLAAATAPISFIQSSCDIQGKTARFEYLLYDDPHHELKANATQFIRSYNFSGFLLQILVTPKRFTTLEIILLSATIALLLGIFIGSLIIAKRKKIACFQAKDVIEFTPLPTDDEEVDEPVHVNDRPMRARPRGNSSKSKQD